MFRRKRLAEIERRIECIESAVYELPLEVDGYPGQRGYEYVMCGRRNRVPPVAAQPSLSERIASIESRLNGEARVG